MQTKQLPYNISIPDMLNMQGQVARCYAETCFQNLRHGQPTAPERATRVRAAAGVQGFEDKLATGFCCNWHDLQKGLLTVDAAKNRKAEHIYQAKKQ